MKAIGVSLAVFLGVFIVVIGTIKLGPVVLSFGVHCLEWVYSCFSSVVGESIISRSDFCLAFFVASVGMAAYLMGRLRG